MQLITKSIGTLIVFALATTADTGGGKAAVVARINGADVTREQFEQRVKARLFQARNAYHEAEKAALSEVIDDMLLESEAKKENTTVQGLLEKHVISKIPAVPSDEVLRVYYEGLDTKDPFDVVRPRIVDHLREKRTARAKAEYVQALRDRARLTTSLQPPRLTIPLNNVQVRGEASAPVTVVEYADYECPYCQQIQPALDKLAAEYKGKIAFAYKDLPLAMHPNAMKAAEAKHCAAQQGKYWDYHDTLVKTNQYQIPSLKQHARTLKLDTSKFDRCLDQGEQASAIDAHIQEAQALGLKGTPTFFINGRFFAGALTYEKLREIVEEELSSSAKSASQAASAR